MAPPSRDPAELEALRARERRASDEIATARRSGATAEEAIARMRALGEQEGALERRLANVEDELQRVLATLPNIPAADAPDGDTVLRTAGEPGEGRRSTISRSPAR